uniref:Uncharacterized protein n=1 Tax=Helianthus annuus TaxID=4232 RepID=A0A251RVG1_HELAN
MVNDERNLLDKENAGALLKEKEERVGWMVERERLVEEDNQKLAAERHWLLSQGFGCFLSAFTQSPDFKRSLVLNCVMRQLKP